MVLPGQTARAAEGDLKLEAQLVKGSNGNNAQGSPVSPEIEKKLKRLPLKWQHYEVVHSEVFTVPPDGEKNVSLGNDCQLTVKNLGGERVELTLPGRGKITQSLPRGQTLVEGGNDENSIVVLRQVE